MKETTKSGLTILLMLLFAAGVYWYVPNKTSIDKCNADVEAVRAYVDGKMVTINQKAFADEQWSFVEKQVLSAIVSQISKLQEEKAGLALEVQQLQMEVSALTLEPVKNAVKIEVGPALEPTVAESEKEHSVVKPAKPAKILTPNLFFRPSPRFRWFRR